MLTRSWCVDVLPGGGFDHASTLSCVYTSHVLELYMCGHFQNVLSAHKSADRRNLSHNQHVCSLVGLIVRYHGSAPPECGGGSAAPRHSQKKFYKRPSFCWHRSIFGLDHFDHFVICKALFQPTASKMQPKMKGKTTIRKMHNPLIILFPGG